jgi:hypothetical protein
MKRTTLVSGLAAGVAGLGTYLAVVRPWHRRWGATDEEVARTMPLDERIDRPNYVTNRAITIQAPPEDVWPWLVQMGELPRGGFYSYEWIERLLGLWVVNAQRILPRCQQLRVGQALDRTGHMLVKAVDPGRFLVLGPPEGEVGDSTWALLLRPLPDGSTRLVARLRAKLPRTAAGAFWYAVLDPGHFVMERKMLLGIKRRAEALAAARATAGLASIGAA